MDKKIAGLIGAAVALTALDATTASARTPDPAAALKTSSYSELLDPVSDAASVLQALDDHAARNPQVAQFYYQDHHHHHHNRYRRLPPVVREFLPHHHHHHHHHHHFYRDWND